jgi:hypothetical protein
MGQLQKMIDTIFKPTTIEEMELSKQRDIEYIAKEAARCVAMASEREWMKRPVGRLRMQGLHLSLTLVTGCKNTQKNQPKGNGCLISEFLCHICSIKSSNELIWQQEKREKS